MADRAQGLRPARVGAGLLHVLCTHPAWRLHIPASCRLSFYLYNTLEEVDEAVAAVAAVATSRRKTLAARLG